MSYNINKNERQQQQQQLPTNNAYNLPKDVSKLDLHGYNKSEGIRRTTEFLDRIASKSKQNSSKAWALVVTGSGAHSSHSQGRKFYYKTIYLFIYVKCSTVQYSTVLILRN